MSSVYKSLLLLPKHTLVTLSIRNNIQYTGTYIDKNNKMIIILIKYVEEAQDSMYTIYSF